MTACDQCGAKASVIAVLHSGHYLYFCGHDADQHATDPAFAAYRPIESAYA